MGWFSELMGADVPLAPVMQDMTSSVDDSVPDSVLLKAHLDRERRKRHDLKDQESDLYDHYSDKDRRHVQAKETARDACMSREESEAAMACLHGAMPDRARSPGVSAEQCMTAWRDGRTIVGGTNGRSASSTHTDTNGWSDSVEGGGGLEVTKDGAKAGLNLKGTHGTNGSSADADMVGNSQSTNWIYKPGYLAQCNAESDAAAPVVESTWNVRDQALRAAETGKTKRAIDAANSVRDSVLGKRP